MSWLSNLFLNTTQSLPGGIAGSHSHDSRVNDSSISLTYQAKRTAVCDSRSDLSSSTVCRAPLDRSTLDNDCSISGFVIISDPLLGHLCVVRCADGNVMVVNISVLDKIYILESKLKVRLQIYETYTTP